MWGSSAIVAAALTLTAAVGAERPAQDDWTLPNLNRASTRAPERSPITRGTVQRLRVLWRFRLPASVSVTVPGESRALVATPIVAGATVYLQDAKSSVYALDRATGALRWKHRFRASNYGRNGVAYSSGSVYGNTDTTAFSLSARTGRLLWQRQLVTPLERFVNIAPLVADDLVYTSTVGYPPGGRGALYALHARTGTVAWKFSTIRDPWRHPKEAGGGGAWYTPSIDEAGNLYTGVANPYPLGGTARRPNGGAFPGPALYTDSLVVLAGRTGRLRWYDQVTPHDVRDYDFHLPPVLASTAVGGVRRELVFGAGKAGIVLAWDRRSHERLWETRVGRHLNDLGRLSARTVTICPGFFGGVQTPMAYAAGRLFVPVVDFCVRGSSHGYQSIDRADPARGSGEFLALDAGSGRVLWRRRLPQPVLGCATAADGVVFTSTFDGQLYGFSSENGRTLWQSRARAGINGCPALAGDMLLVPSGIATTGMRKPVREVVAYGLR